jgi:3-methylcrotonyl-CoA carboxylase alpha subunit
MGFAIMLDGTAHEVEIVGLRPHLKLRIEGREYSVIAEQNEEDGRRTIEIDGKPVRFARVHVAGRQILRMDGRTFAAVLIDPRDIAEAAAGSHDQVRTPMPGTVVHVYKRAGEAVTRGETLIIIESMKLQMALAAPRDGVLAELKRGVGERFDKDEVVAELEPLGRAGN